MITLVTPLSDPRVSGSDSQTILILDVTDGKWYMINDKNSVDVEYTSETPIPYTHIPSGVYTNMYADAELYITEENLKPNTATILLHVPHDYHIHSIGDPSIYAD